MTLECGDFSPLSALNDKGLVTLQPGAEKEESGEKSPHSKVWPAGKGKKAAKNRRTPKLGLVQR
jgi:hypothetical protein